MRLLVIEFYESQKAINYGVITISTTTLRTKCLEFMQKVRIIAIFIARIPVKFSSFSWIEPCVFWKN